MRGPPLFIALGLLAGPSMLSAQFVWTGLGISGAATDPLNWLDASPLGSGDEDLLFTDTLGHSIVGLPLGSSFGTITFSGEAFQAMTFQAINLEFAQMGVSGDVFVGDNFDVLIDSSVRIVLTGGDHIASVAEYSQLQIHGGMSGLGALIKEGLGALEMSGEHSYEGGTVVRAGMLTLAEGNITHPDADTIVGGQEGDSAHLVIEGGSTLTNRSGIVGQGTGSLGEASVLGGGSWLSSGSLTVGADGTGYLYVGAEGSVVSGDGLIGALEGSFGYAYLENGGSWTIADHLVVGGEGQGSLSIISDAQVTSGSAAIGTGPVAALDAYAYVGGGTWMNSGHLAIGDSQAGALSIYDAGGVFTDSLAAGILPGSEGFLTVSEADSFISIDGAADLGVSGFNQTYVFDGGSFEAGATTLAVNPGSESWGYVEGPGSSWTSLGLTIAKGGEAMVYVSDGGLLRVLEGPVVLGQEAGSVGTLYLGWFQEVFSGSGIVDAAEVTTGAGSGEIIFGTNHSADSPYSFTRDGLPSGTPVLISGATRVLNHGGYTVLHGDNTYTGGTEVVWGTLIGAGNSAFDRPFGTGTIAVSSGGTIAADPNTFIGNTLELSSGARLAGAGTFSTASIAHGAILAPGMASHRVAELNFMDLTLGPGGVFEVDLRFTDGLLVYDQINVLSVTTLHLDATSENPFTFRLISLSGEGVAGSLADLTLGSTYELTLFETSGIEGTLTLGDNLLIDTSQFFTGFPEVQFGFTQEGNDLLLTFTPVPEPSTYALLVSGLAAVAGWSLRRSRR